MKFSVLFLLLFFVSHESFTQPGNLIPNSSFEEYRVLPDDVGQARKCLVSWKIPNMKGNGDYYHSNCSTKKAGTKRNYFGKQSPHTGLAYMGICITNGFREYLQVELKETLLIGRQYEITAFISCADKKRLGKVDEFNVLFSKKTFKVPNKELLLTPPDIRFKGEYTNKKEWMKISAIYTANGTEKFLTFGTFAYLEKGKKQGEISGVSNYAHYYIDDISLHLANNEEQIQPLISVATPIEQDSIGAYSIGEKYVFNSLLFESGKSVLLVNEYPELDDLILFLEKHPEFKLQITGHTDKVGNAEFNLKLSYERANAVKTLLIGKGVNQHTITIEGKGDTVPLSSNDTEKGREINRRVEILLVE